MPRRPDDNVVPFRPRPKPRKWTRPEDFGHDPRQARKRPKTDWGRVRLVAGVWVLIAGLVAVTVAWHFWG